VQVEFRGPRTFGLLGPLANEDADQLLDAMAGVGSGGPITLDLTGVTSIDDGGVAAIRGAMKKMRDSGELLILLLPQTEALDQVLETGLDEEQLILVEVLETWVPVAAECRAKGARHPIDSFQGQPCRRVCSNKAWPSSKQGLRATGAWKGKPSSCSGRSTYGVRCSERPRSHRRSKARKGHVLARHTSAHHPW
jgi:anti-anti-sigma regulatory factor